VDNFFKDLELFLNKFQITETKTDVFENMIYQMAGISELPHKSKLETSYSDRTRVHFEITGMSDENLDKLMTFIKSLGDETVIKNPSRRSHSGHLESASISKSMHYERAMTVEQAMRISDLQNVKLKEDTIELDGEFLAKTVFPLFQAHISELAKDKPELLIPYQEKSKAFMEVLNKLNNKPNEPSVASLGIFGQGSRDLVVEEVTEQMTLS
jgi:hypothetical protein